MKIRIAKISVVVIMLLITSIGCTRFISETENNSYPAREKNCELTYLSKAPIDRDSYVVLGECRGKGMKGIVSSEYEAAHKRVEACACKNGGNAIILTNSYTQGGTDQYGRRTQYNAVVVATVIYIK